MARKQKSSRKKTILMTGGHGGTTALAVVQEIKEQDRKWDLHFVGAKKAFEGRAEKTLEFNILPRHDVTFHGIVAGKLQKRLNITAVISLIKIPIGFIHAILILLRIKPDLILSFGGYSSVPVVFIGAVMGTPVILQEQIMGAGWANRVTSVFAKKIAISRAVSTRHFDPSKTVLTGIPLTKYVLNISPKRALGATPHLLITGGSRGAMTINDLVSPILTKLLKNYRITHLSGALDADKFKKFRNGLPPRLKGRYEHYSEVHPKKMAMLYDKSDVVVSRAGANTVAEVMHVKRPAIFIPITWSLMDEQFKNAEFAKEYGIARILKQDGLKSDVLLNSIKSVTKNWKKIVNRVIGKESPDLNAAKALLNLVDAELK